MFLISVEWMDEEKSRARFTLPGREEPLRVRGRVQWVREYSDRNNEVPPGVGIQFVEPTEEVLAAVRSFIGKREPGFYE